jgi:hypothetical protein
MTSKLAGAPAWDGPGPRLACAVAPGRARTRSPRPPRSQGARRSDTRAAPRILPTIPAFSVRKGHSDQAKHGPGDHEIKPGSERAALRKRRASGQVPVITHPTSYAHTCNACPHAGLPQTVPNPMAVDNLPESWPDSDCCPIRDSLNRIWHCP